MPPSPSAEGGRSQTLRETAAALGLAPSTLARLERGETTSLETIAATAAGLSLALDPFCPWLDPSPARQERML